MHRREALAVLGAVSVAGCSRLRETNDGGTEPDDSDNGVGRTIDESTADGGTDTDDSAGDSPAYSTREEAIEYVGSFADDDAPEFGTYDGDGPETIAFATRSGGTSGSTGEDGSEVHAEDLDIVPHDGERIAFGGDLGRSLRVRNLATGSTLTFEPDAGTETYEADRIKVDTRASGTLREDTPTLYVPDREESTVNLPGAWSGDDELFRHQTFARYVVELVENDTVVGATAGGVFANGYRWGMDQTRDAAFVTRQPGVRADWYAEFRLGELYEPEGRVEAIHRPDAGVFEVDLTALDAEPGEYEWRLHVSDEPGGSRLDRFVELSPSFGNTVFVE